MRRNQETGKASQCQIRVSSLHLGSAQESEIKAHARSSIFKRK